MDEVAYVPIEELQQIEEFDEELVDALRARARDVLITQEIAREEELGGGVPDQDLVELDGMDGDLARRLSTQGVVSRDDLADLATDELVEMTGSATNARASSLWPRVRPGSKTMSRKGNFAWPK